MKFDVIVGNPPFSLLKEGNNQSKGGTNLYPLFYKKSVELADKVAMIMPNTSMKVMAEHNNFIKQTAYKAEPITDEMQKTMGVTINMWTIYYDSNKDPCNVSFIIDRPINNIPFNIGKVRLSKENINFRETPDTEYTVEVISRLTIRGGMEKVWFKPCDVIKKAYLTKKYAVLIPHLINKEWARTDIVENYGQAISCCVYYIETDTYEEAKRYQDIITSEKFMVGARELRAEMGQLTLNKFKRIQI